MTTLCIMLQHSIAQPQFSRRALRFCRQALQQGHRIECVFFYRQAVDHAAQSNDADTREVQQQWQQFARQHDVALVACHTVAERLNIGEFAEGFEDSGLTALVQAMASADRTLQF